MISASISFLSQLRTKDQKKETLQVLETWYKNDRELKRMVKPSRGLLVTEAAVMMMGNKLARNPKFGFRSPDKNVMRTYRSTALEAICAAWKNVAAAGDAAAGNESPTTGEKRKNPDPQKRSTKFRTR